MSSDDLNHRESRMEERTQFDHAIDEDSYVSQTIKRTLNVKQQESSMGVGSFKRATLTTDSLAFSLGSS